MNVANLLAGAARGLFLLAAGCSGLVHAAELRVAKTGDDVGNCTSSPCKTVGFAISRANAAGGDRIVFLDNTPQTYAETLVIDRPIEIVGTGSNLSGGNFTAIAAPAVPGPGARAVITTRAANVVLRNFAIVVDLSTTDQAVRALSGAGFSSDGLQLQNLHLRADATGAVTSAYGERNAVMVNPTFGPHFSVTVNATRIDGTVTMSSARFFRAGVDALNAGVIATENDIFTQNHDLKLTDVKGSIVATGNIFRFGGVQVGSFRGEPGPETSVTISDNRFHFGPGAAFPALRLIDNNRVNAGNTAYPVTLVSGNEFGDASPAATGGVPTGVFLQNYPSATLQGNVFVPPAASAGFAHVIVSNKEIYTNAVPSAPVKIEDITIRDNQFRGRAGSTDGNAIVFLNHNDAGGAAEFGAITVSGNDFSDELDLFIRLSPDTGMTGNPYFYAAPSIIPPTQMAPFDGDIDALDNLFGTVDTGGATTQSQRSSVIARVFDRHNNPALGRVLLGFGDASVVHVDDDFAGDAHGHAETFVHGQIPGGSTTVYYGVDAFANLADAQAALAPGGTIYLADGSYGASTISQRVTLIGNGSGSSFNATLTIDAGGASAADRLVLRDLRVQGAPGDGLRLTGSRSFVTLHGVESIGNGGNGLQVFTNNASTPASGTLTTDLRIEDSRFLDNGPAGSNQYAGLLFDESASVAGLTIDGSWFNGNAAAGLTFNDVGAAGGSAAQIADVTITDSQFNANAPTNTGAAGGGLWLKTAQSGTRIDRVSITGSQFFDNGSGGFQPVPNRAINANGISVRARPGTFITGVVICGNDFGDTPAGGTQLAGIYVFDDTGSTGYQPIEVCGDNEFTGLNYSVSGHEQKANRNTQPIVRVTGDALIPAAEEINTGYVRNVTLGIDYPSIAAALNASVLADGHEIFAPEGWYNEQITIPRDGIVLRGAGKTLTVIDGGAGGPTGHAAYAGSGILVVDRENIAIRDLRVQNFTAIGASEGGCIAGHSGRLDGLRLAGVALDNCRGGGGAVYLNTLAGVDDVAFTDNLVSNFDGRGLVIWNGAKSRLTITGNHVTDLDHGPGNGAIEVQDGTASGVTVSNNTITGSFDAGMNLVQLGGSLGANLVADNTITLSARPSASGNVGPRFGLQLALPNGTGADDASPGAIVVRDNTLTLVSTTDARDLAGIAVIRRNFCNTCGQVDTTRGVVVRDNLIQGFHQPDATVGNDGFGIAMEGTLGRVFGNVIVDSDIAIQLQQGADGNQDAANAFFGRGTAAQTCSYVGSNTVDGVPQQGPSVSLSAAGDVPLQAGVRNESTLERFCTIQSAIDDAHTLAMHRIAVPAGTYPENIVLSKPLVLSGAQFALAGDGVAGAGENPALRSGTNEAVISPASGHALRVTADGATVEGFTFTGMDGSSVALASGGNYGGVANDVVVRNNRFVALQAVALYTNTDTASTGALRGWDVHDNLFEGIDNGAHTASAINLWKMDDADIRFNTIRDVAWGGIQLVEGDGVRVTRNTVQHTGHNGINLGPQLSNITVFRNAVVDANTSHAAEEGALTVFAASSDLTVSCNLFDQAGGGDAITTTDDAAGTLGSGIAIFHNDIGGGLAHAIAGSDFFVGSNFFVPAAPAIGGAQAARVFVADPLAASALASSDCGDNTPVAIAAHAGAGQVRPVLNAFDPLQARVTDAFGGAVPGVGVDFAAPASGAFAALGTPSGSTDYNGIFETSATANGLAGGPYDVRAATAGVAPDAAFALSNAMADATLDITGIAPAPSQAGQSVTVNYTLLGSSPSGNVIVTASSGETASCPVASSCAIQLDTPRRITLTVSYPGDANNGAASDSIAHLVRYAPNAIATLQPATAPTPSDNDYTRVNEAMQALNIGVTVVLDGRFDWTEANAAASWARGSDGVAGNDDDYTVVPAKNFAGVTVTAAAVPSDAGTPLDPSDDLYAGAIVGPGDLAAANLEGVFHLDGGAFRQWTFSNLDYRGFDLPIGMFFSGGPPDAFLGVQVIGNRFVMAPDLNSTAAPADVSQNIALHYAFGHDQRIAGNGFVIEASGENDAGASASTVVMQSNTSGNAYYDGLRIQDNVVVVVGQQGQAPMRVLGLWENDNAFMGTDVRIERNVLRNLSVPHPLNATPANYTAIRHTSYSGGGKHVVIAANLIEGWNVGISSIHSTSPAFTHTPPASVAPVHIVGNTIRGAATAAVRISSTNGNAAADIQFNRLAGNGAGVVNLATPPFVLNAGRVTAENNWWGCNGGPGAGAPGCAAVANAATGVAVTDWLRLHLRSDGITTAGNAQAFEALIGTAPAPMPGIADYPGGEVSFDASLGSVASPVALATGVAANTLSTVAGDQGGALIAATYDDQTVTTLVRVNPTGCAEGDACTFTIAAAGAAGDALDNDYTRIDNAVQAMSVAGDVVQLSGAFDWTTGAARASWSRGSDGIAGNDDDYAVRLRPGLHGGTLRALAPGAASIAGEQSGNDFTLFVTAFNGANQDWTFEDLSLSGFDAGIGLFWSGADDFDGTTFADNTIAVPADTDGDASGNYGLYTGFGDSQTIEGNTIAIDIEGTDASSRAVGIQIGDSCNVACFDGLRVTGNTVTVSGTPATPAAPPRLFGIWENAGDGNSAITVEENTFIGSGGSFIAVQDNLQAGIVLTTQSNAANGKWAVARGNTITGAARGITTQFGFGYFTAAPDALRLEGNTLLDNGDALTITAGLAAAGHPARAQIHYNRIAGNVRGLVVEDSLHTLPAGDPTYGGAELPSIVAANDNWFGCNAGPGQPGCDVADLAGGAGAPSVTLDTWLTMALSSDLATVPLGGATGLNVHFNRNSGGLDVSGTTRFPVAPVAFTLAGNNALLAAPQATTGDAPATVGRARNGVSSVVATETVHATLDGETRSVVVTVENVLLDADIPPAAALGVQTQPFPVHLSNGSPVAFGHLAISFAVAFDGDDASTGLMPADLVLQYEASPGDWVSIALADANGDGVLEGNFAVGTLPAGADLTRQLRATALRDGVYAIDAALYDTVTSTPYAEDGGDVSVAGPDDVRLSLVSGSPQTAPVGLPYAVAATVRVADEAGRALSGVSVDFAAPASGANVSYQNGSVFSGRDGHASSGKVSANNIAGSVSGAMATVPAPNCDTAACSVAFDFTNTATAPSTVTLAQVGSSHADTIVNSAFAGQFCATVRDASNNPVPNVSVAFLAPNTGATAQFAAATVLSAANGEACTTVSANTVAGSYAIRAQIAGAAGSNAIVLVNQPDVAASVALLATPLQAQVSTGSYTFTATVRDGFGNLVADGTSVVFDTPNTGAGVTPIDATNAIIAGLTSISATANAITGAFDVKACVGVVCSPVVVLTNTLDTTAIALSLSGDTLAAVTVAGGPLYARSQASTSNSGPAPSENVLAHVSLARVGGARVTDVSIDYRAASNETGHCEAASPGFWCELPLADGNGDGVLEAVFGPPGGFALTDGATSYFRTAYHLGGRWTLDVSLDGVSTGTTYAGDGFVVDVAHAQLVQVPQAAAGTVGVAVNSSSALANTGTAALDSGQFPLPHAAAGAPNDINVLARYVVTGSAPLGGGDVLVEYYAPAQCPSQVDGWCDIAAEDATPGDTVLEGGYGPAATGFPLPAGYDATTLFRSTFLVPGTYVIATQLVGVDGSGARTGIVYAEAVQSVSIGTGAAASIHLISGNGQSTTVATAFAQPLLVEVRDIGGNAVPNAAVSFQAIAAANGASSQSGAQLSNGSGRAGFTATANSTAGAYSLRASLANGMSVDFALANAADATSNQVQIAAVSGDGQTATVHSDYALPLGVRVTDRFGNALPGRDVIFQAAPEPGASAGFVQAGGADAITVTTDVAGFAASGTVRANPSAGEVPVAASVEGTQCVLATVSICTVEFMLRNVQAAAGSVTLDVLSASSALVGSADAYALQATVRDAFGNPVPGVSVTFAGPGAGAGVTQTVVVASTDALGQVAHVFDANGLAGGFAMQAHVSGLEVASATLENLPGGAAAVTLQATPLEAVAGSGSYTLTALARDVFGNAVANGTQVVFDAPQSGASLAPSDASDATLGGLAMRLAAANATAGSFAVTACAGSVCSAPVTLTNIVDADDITLTLAGDTVGAVVADGGPTYSYLDAEVGNDGAAPGENVLADLRIERAGGALPADVTVQYRASFDEDGSGPRCVAEGAEVWCTLAFAQAGNALAAEFGPPGTGFALLDGAVSAFRARFARGGAYTVRGALRGVTSGTRYAEGATAIDVAQLTLVNTPAAIAGQVGEAMPSSSTLRNVGTAAIAPASALPNAANVTVRYVLTGPAGIDSSDVLIEFHDPAQCGGDGWCDIATEDAVPGDGELEGRFGPAAGFPVPAGYDATTLLRATFLVPGNYTIATRLLGVGADNTLTGLVYASSAQTVAIGTGNAATIHLVSGDGQSNVVNTAFAAPLVVEVRDVGGNPVTGASVAFNAVVAVGGAASSSGGAMSMANGQAQFVPNANTVVGGYAVRASLSNGQSVQFAADNRPGAPAALQYVAGSGQTVAVSSAFAPLQVRVVDAFGNAAADAAAAVVSFGAPASGASAVVSATAISGAGGLASVAASANGTAGSYVVSASFNGSGVAFALSNAAQSIAIGNLRWSESGTATTIYSGTGKSAAFDATPAGGVTCSTQYNGSATLPVNAGQYLVHVACEDAAGGLFGVTSATLDIVKAAAGITLTGGTFIYDGAPVPAGVTNPNGAAFAVSYRGTGSTAYGPSGTPPSQAGSYVATLTVNDANYEETVPPSASILIDPAPVSLAFGNLAHVYDGSAKAASVATTPAGVAGVTLSYAPDAVPVNAGAYTVTASLANPNYVLEGGNSATLTIAKATAQVTLANLTQLFDGTPKPVAVTTMPAALATTVTYDGSSAAPSAVGSHAVVATVNDLNYAGSAGGTLTILAAGLSGLEANGSVSIAGIAGAPLATLPSVKVVDANGNGVPSVTVQFDLASGGGSGGGQAATDAAGIATAPAWILGADAGSNTMTARVAGLAGLPTLTFTATGAESTDLSIAIDSAQQAAEAGQQVTYTILVGNAGPSHAAHVAVSDVLPDEFASATWTCTAAGGALCGVSANGSGTGDVLLDARIPNGGSLTIVLVATLAPDAPIGRLDTVASVTAVSGEDPDASDNNAIYTIDVLPQGGVAVDVFGNGFEDQ